MLTEIRERKMIEITTVTESTITCDLCGDSTLSCWRKRGFDDTEIKPLILRQGKSYPEGGEGTNTRIDVCPKCFLTILVPMVTDRGYQPTVTDWEF